MVLFSINVRVASSMFPKSILDIKLIIKKLIEKIVTNLEIKEQMEPTGSILFRFLFSRLQDEVLAC